MAFRQFTTEQAAAFRDKVRPMLRFLLFCKRQRDIRGVDPNGSLYRLANKAYDAIHALHIELHYQACGHGVGRSSSEACPDHADDGGQASGQSCPSGKPA